GALQPGARGARPARGIRAGAGDAPAPRAGRAGAHAGAARPLQGEPALAALAGHRVHGRLQRAREEPLVSATPAIRQRRVTPPASRVIALATTDPFDRRTFSGLSANLFGELLRRGVSIEAIATKQIRWLDLLGGAVRWRALFAPA